MPNQKCNLLIWAAVMLPVCAAALWGCAGRDEPPFITAAVTNVYRELSQVEDFALLYWWEERGETPFLKPYTLRSKELIVEIAVPYDHDPQKVDIRTRRIPLGSVDTIEVVLHDFGKTFLVSMHDGEQITTTTRFPQSLKKDPRAGFADHKVYVSGTVNENTAPRPFKAEIDLIKSIKILSVRDTR